METETVRVNRLKGPVHTKLSKSESKKEIKEKAKKIKRKEQECNPVRCVPPAVHHTQGVHGCVYIHGVSVNYYDL